MSQPTPEPPPRSAEDASPRAPDDALGRGFDALDEGDPVEAAVVPEDRSPEERLPASRRWLMLPLVLFFLTCLSTFVVGCLNWDISYYGATDASSAIRQAIVARWEQGLTYMACVLAILFAHEMGHFLMTLWHGVPASYPFFIPFPLSPFGTMGAVISMDGVRANRREIFDIGLAGPLAGLVVAIPITAIGITQLDFTEPGYGIGFGLPLLVTQWLRNLQPTGYEGQTVVYASQMNPYFAAGWVGLMITGLNMMPVSQLDGGHVSYCLLGTIGHWLARAFLIFTFLYMVFAEAPMFSPMAVLVALMGVDHPPTADDEAEMGTLRYVIGIASLAIPVLCFPPQAIVL